MQAPQLLCMQRSDWSLPHQAELVDYYKKYPDQDPGNFSRDESDGAPATGESTNASDESEDMDDDNAPKRAKVNNGDELRL